MAAEAALPYAIRRSPRAKRMRLVVKPSGVEVVIPANMAEASALEFMNSQRAWIDRTVRELKRRQDACPVAATQDWSNGAGLPFRGVEIPLEIVDRAGTRTKVTVGDRFQIAIAAVPAATHARRVEAVVFAWTKIWLLGEAQRITASHAPRCGLQPREFRIKRMRTRWGSCGPRNDVNLNWLLAFTPPEVLEYVVVHELCHIRHRDHSARFWALVGQHLPRYAEARDWLRRNGGALLARFP